MFVKNQSRSPRLRCNEEEEEEEEEEGRSGGAIDGGVSDEGVSERSRECDRSGSSSKTHQLLFFIRATLRYNTSHV